MIETIVLIQLTGALINLWRLILKIEVKDDDKVIIDDFEYYGHIDQKQFCSKCQFNLVYYEDFDAYFLS